MGALLRRLKELYHISAEVPPNLAQSSAELRFTRICLLIRFLEPAFLHKPPGGLWTEVDAKYKRHCWYEGASELKTPSDCANILICTSAVDAGDIKVYCREAATDLHGKISAGTQENAKRRPDLPGFSQHYALPNRSFSPYQDMTRPPRTEGGATSAEKTGTVTSFKPIPCNPSDAYPLIFVHLY